MPFGETDKFVVAYVVQIRKVVEMVIVKDVDVAVIVAVAQCPPLNLSRDWAREISEEV